MIKILSIGNSFSQDAHRYLHGVFTSFGEESKVVNLYIGGCTLATHYKHMNNDAKAYQLGFNGEMTGFMVSIKEALQSDLWDVVTVQQQSSSSADYDTFQPYLNALVDYVRFHSPKSKLVLQQTWGYEPGSVKLINAGYTDYKEMYDKVFASYNRIKEEIGADFIIPSGQTMRNLIESGASAYRDGFHAGLGAGRFAIALTWYGMLTGNSFEDVKFSKFDVEVTEEEYKLAIESASKAVAQYR